jgi:uncharacterized damage-inducible protein DinB
MDSKLHLKPPVLLIARYYLAMMIDRLLRHMSWANQSLYSSVASLPDAALDSYLVNPEWTAREILRHIASGSTWYNHCLGLQMWREIAAPAYMSDVSELAKLLAELDQQIIDASRMADGPVTFQDEHSMTTVLGSTLFSQAVHHATEHRAQLVDALEARGYKVIALDDLDLWSFERYEKELSA